MQHKDQDSQPSSKRTPLIVMVVCAVIAALCIAIFAFSSGQKDKTALSERSASETANRGKAAQEAAQDFEIKQDPGLLDFLKKITRNDAKDAKGLGKPDAPVLLLEFSEISCPLCHRYHEEIAPKLKPYIDNGTLRVEYHHRLIFNDRYNSVLGAKAAEAAGRQGKFWEFLDASTTVLHKQSKETGDGHLQWDDNVVDQVAKVAGIADMERFKKDLNDPEIQKMVEKEDGEGLNLSINGTPTFLVNNKYIIEGAQDISTFKTVIEAAKQK